MADNKALAPALGRWTRTILVISLAANLLFLGLMAGSALNQARQPDRTIVRELGFGPFASALSREDRAAVRRSLQAEAPRLRDIRRETRQEARRLIAALRQVPYDEAAVRDILIGLQARTAARLQLGQTLLLRRIAEMSDTERKAFAGRLQAGLKVRRTEPAE